MDEIIKDIFATLKENGINELPYYACHYIADGVVSSIEDNEIRYRANATAKDLVYFLYCLRKELTNRVEVTFNWGSDEVEKRVILLHCAEYRGCFDTRGTWMHLIYNPMNMEYIAYCNIRDDAFDKKKTKECMKNIKRIA